MWECDVVLLECVGIWRKPVRWGQNMRMGKTYLERGWGRDCFPASLSIFYNTGFNMCCGLVCGGLSFGLVFCQILLSAVVIIMLMCWFLFLWTNWKIGTCFQSFHRHLHRQAPMTGVETLEFLFKIKKLFVTQNIDLFFNVIRCAAWIVAIVSQL